jgi:hypothetical protein
MVRRKHRIEFDERYLWDWVNRPFGTGSFAGVPGSELPGYSRMSLRDGTKSSNSRIRRTRTFISLKAQAPRGPSGY